MKGLISLAGTKHASRFYHHMERRFCFQLAFRFFSKSTTLAVFSNSTDPDQTPHNAASDQDLHFLHQIQEFLENIVTTKTKQIPCYWKQTGP